MVSRQPHADVAILVLHSSDVGRETFFTSQRWPVRPVVEGRSGLPLGMLGVAPAWAGCGGHACSLRQPHGRMRIGGGASGSGTTRVLDKSLAESPATITGQRSPRRMCRSDLRCPSLPTNHKTLRVTFVINAGRGLKQLTRDRSQLPGCQLRPTRQHRLREGPDVQDSRGSAGCYAFF